MAATVMAASVSHIVLSASLLAGADTERASGHAAVQPPIPLRAYIAKWGQTLRIIPSGNAGWFGFKSGQAEPDGWRCSGVRATSTARPHAMWLVRRRPWPSH